MDLFDSIIDGFASKGLKPRVMGVIIFGFVICAAVAFALYTLLSSTHQITINGVGRLDPEQAGVLSISVNAEEMQRLAELPSLSLQLLDPQQGYVNAEAQVISIDPATSTVRADSSGLPEQLLELPKIELRIIVLDRPMWRLLWGK